jgi:probable rRNA maturation factor
MPQKSPPLKSLPLSLPLKSLAPSLSLSLSLSLQFGAIKDVALHRAALPRHKVARWLRHSLTQDAEITVRIVDADEARALNRDYRQKDYATNVLTFDYAQSPLVMADLVLCAPVVAAEAQTLHRPLQDHYAHLLVHGALHALGHDHETSDADADAMEALETSILARLGFGDPYR